MNILKTVITVILFFALLILAILNTNQSVDINFYQWKSFHDVPLWVIIFSSIAIGIIISAIVGLSEHIKLKLQLSRMRKRIKQLEEEISSLRNIPIAQVIQEEQEIIANKNDQEEEEIPE